MAEIIFRIPSRTVQYGYIELPVTIEGDPSPEVMASLYVSWTYAFQKEEQAAVDRIAERPPTAPEKPLDVGVPGAAEQRVESDLKPRSVDEANDMAVVVIKRELGATEVPAGDIVGHEGTATTAPWVEVVDAKPKPWETEATAPAVIDAAW